MVFLPTLFTKQSVHIPGPFCLCSVTGQIDQLAYISTNEYRFDGREKSVVCSVSTDCTVRAWDLREVSWPLGEESKDEIAWILTVFLVLAMPIVLYNLIY
jgi:hypothetical protein